MFLEEKPWLELARLECSENISANNFVLSNAEAKSQDCWTKLKHQNYSWLRALLLFDGSRENQVSERRYTLLFCDYEHLYHVTCLHHVDFCFSKKRFAHIFCFFIIYFYFIFLFLFYIYIYIYIYICILGMYLFRLHQKQLKHKQQAKKETSWLKMAGVI